MIAAGFLTGIVLLTVWFGGLLDQQRNPNQSPQNNLHEGFVEVVLDRNRQGHYLFTGAINGVPVELLVDTGATDVVVPEHVARDLGLVRGRVGFANTANGTVKVYATTINQLDLGGIVLLNVPASINPGMGDLEILLGMSALKHIELTQRGGTLTLRQHFNQ